MSERQEKEKKSKERCVLPAELGQAVAVIVTERPDDTKFKDSATVCAPVKSLEVHPSQAQSVGNTRTSKGRRRRKKKRITTQQESCALSLAVYCSPLLRACFLDPINLLKTRPAALHAFWSPFSLFVKYKETTQSEKKAERKYEK